MNYEDEDYVRLYTRETITWKALGWEGQACVLFLMKGKFDRSGLIEIGENTVEEAVVALTGLPEEVVKKGMPRVLEKKVLELHECTLVWPRFIEAQTATKSPVERQREYRQRKRDMIRAGIDPSLREAVIYFVQSENGGAVKIGRADDLAKRIAGLQTGRPDKLVLLAAFSGTRADERELHALLAEHRETGEWFRPHPQVMAAANFASRHGSRVIDAIKTGNVSCHVIGSPSVTESASPVTKRDSKPSTVASPVTPSLAEPIRAEPTSPEPGGAGGDRIEQDFMTECPPDLAERCAERGITASLAKKYSVTEADVDTAIRQYAEHFTTGRGFGEKRRHWAKQARGKVLDLHREGRLAGLGSASNGIGVAATKPAMVLPKGVKFGTDGL